MLIVALTEAVVRTKVRLRMLRVAKYSLFDLVTTDEYGKGAEREFNI